MRSDIETLLSFAHALGFTVLVFGLGYIFSRNRQNVSFRLVGVGIALSLLLIYAGIRFEPITQMFRLGASAVAAVVKFAGQGASTIWGNLANYDKERWGFVFLAQIVPGIIFVSALIETARHLGIVSFFSKTLGSGFRLLLGKSISHAEGFVAAVNILVGQAQAPIFVKDSIPSFSRSQIHAMMTCGFATISGELYAVYAGYLKLASDFELSFCIQLLLIQCVTATLLALVLSKVVSPTESNESQPHINLEKEVPKKPYFSIIDAALSGATTGWRIGISMAIMLVTFVAIVKLVDGTALTLISAIFPSYRAPESPLTSLLGFVCRPIAWLIGLDWERSAVLSVFFGKAFILTEFSALDSLANSPELKRLPADTVLLTGLALCSFANLPSIGVQVSAWNELCKERRNEFVSIAPSAMLCGLAASWLTATFIGCLL